ncbi:MAG: CBS domain-containing protein, partial [Candidatus Thermoplasmatota archaeon]|nr:CBS domain-containing protein [Candidatus Thermoplasmatota archaeon]
WTKSAVVQTDGMLVGYLSLEEIKEDTNLSTTTVEEVMIPDPFTIGKNENIHSALDMLTKSSLGKLVVVDPPDSRKILGTIGLDEIADAYNREIRRIKSMAQ